MRLPIAIAAVLVLAGCERSHAPLPPVAAPAAVATASAPAPPTELPKPPIAKKKKPSPPVLAPIVKSGTSTRRAENGAASNDDPCADLDDAALDDCIAREEADQSTSGRRDDNRRPELEPRDRELIDAEEAAARDRDGNDGEGDIDASEEYPPPDDDPMFDENSPPEEYPDEYPPDENSYEPLPDDPYNR